MKTICVMGLGYIGLPSASVLATCGFKVLGVDVSSPVVDTINRGNVHIEEPGLHTEVQAAIGSGNLRASLAAEPADVFIIAVPTPLTKDKRADMSYVVRAAEAIMPFLREGNLVILESTSPPGTSRDLLAPMFIQAGWRIGVTLHLAHCPERVLPGRILHELVHNARVIGGYTPECAEAARRIYAKFVDGDILLTDVTTAEMVKVTENTFRDVNIALANETALLCEKLSIDFWEVARLTNHHPRVNLHNAGPGVGGHCISVDPWFLVERFPEDTGLISTARRRNDGMPHHVARRVMALLAGVEKPKVAALGLAFKGNVDDTRESPAYEVISLLQEEGVFVAVHDPYVKTAEVELSSLEECFRGADCVVLLADHSDYCHLNPPEVARLARNRVLLDCRNFLDRAQWSAAGFHVETVGRG